jgi:hypothetical protein
MEKGQTISGRIKGFFGGNIKKGAIGIVAPKITFFETATTDDKGEFMVNTLFKDSTLFLIQARTKRGGAAGIDIQMDKQQFAPPAHKGFFDERQFTPQMNEYFNATRDRYYIEGGERVYNLKEVVVTAQRKSSRTSNIYAGGVNTHTVSGEDIERLGSHNAYDAVMRLPGVTIQNSNEIHIRNNSQAALIVINDVAYEDVADMLKDISSSDIENLSLLHDTDAIIFGSQGAGGAIVVQLKEGKNLPASAPPGMLMYAPLGYCDNVEFYSPTYDTPKAKESARYDKRSTIYWSPSLRLDADGQATITYYTPDSYAPEEIVIEGIDKKGKVCRITQTINLSLRPH